MTLRKFAGAFCFVILISFGTVAASASTLTGAVITGNLSTDFLRSVNVQFSSPVTAGAGIEFTGSFHDSIFNQDFSVTADFNATDLIVAVASARPLDNYETMLPSLFLSFSGFPSGFTGFDTYTHSCNPAAGFFCPTVNGLYSNSFDGTTLKLSFYSIYSGDTYDFGKAPEPSSLILLGLGALTLGGAGVLHRRQAMK